MRSANIARILAASLLVCGVLATTAYMQAAPSRQEATLRTASIETLRNLVQGTGKDDPRALFHFGKRLLAAGEEDACRILEKAVEKSPQDAEIAIAAAEAAQVFHGSQQAQQLLKAYVERNPENPAGRIALAEEYLRDQRNSEALAQVAEVLKRNRRSPDALRILAICQSAGNDNARAEATLRTAVSFDPRNPLTQSALGDVLYDKQKYSEAIACYRAALAVRPNLPSPNKMLALSLLATDLSPTIGAEAKDRATLAIRGDDGNYLAHFALGLAFLRLKEPEKAWQEFDTARLMNPTYVPAYYQLAEAAKQMGRRDDRAHWLQEHQRIQAFIAEKDVRQAKHRAVAGDPKKLREMALSFVRYLVQNGDFAAALSLYKDLLAGEPGGSLKQEWNALLRDPRCREYLLINTPTPQLKKRAREALEKRDFPEALAYFTTMVRRNRTNAEAFDQAGYAALRTGNADLAVKFWKDALRNDPRQSSPYFGLARVASDLRLDEEASWYIRQFLKLRPDSPNGWFLAGDIAREDTVQAEEAYARAVRLAPTNPLYHAALGEQQAANNKIAEAEASFRTALRLGGEDPEVLIRAGAFFTSRPSNAEEGLQLLEKARQQVPDDPMVLYRIGLAYAAKKEYTRAQEALSAARKGPLGRDAAYALAQIYQKQGDTGRASQLRAEAGAMQKRYLTAVRSQEQQSALSPEGHLRLARERAATPGRVAALVNYEAYLTLRPEDQVVRQEYDNLVRSLTAEGLAIPRNVNETVLELHDYRDLPPLTDRSAGQSK